MSAHAWLSPSGGARWMRCALSAILEKDMPNTSSAFADEGTLAHSLGEYCLRSGNNAKTATTELIEFTDSDGVLCKIPSGMPEYVQIYVDNIRQYAEGGILFIEQRLPISHITGEPDAHGTSDAVILQPLPDGTYELQAHDLKYGRGIEVEAENNEQLLMYASGAVEQYDMIYDISLIRVVIHQPRINSAPIEWTCSRDDLRAFNDRVRYARLQIDNCATEWGKLSWPRSPEGIEVVSLAYGRPSDKACVFCKAKAFCPALKKFVTKTVFDDFAALDVDEPPPVVSGELQDAAALSRMMAATDLIEKWIKAVRGEVERRLLAGEQIPDWKLVQGRGGNRAWSDEEEAEKVFKAARIKKDDMYSLKLISPTVAEKLLKKEKPRLWPKIEALITRSEGQPHVAHVSDKREALEIAAAASEFEVVDVDVALPAPVEAVEITVVVEAEQTTAEDFL